jgi:hypothetical protein
MPEAAFDLNDRVVFRQNNIWATRQIAYVQPETKAEAVKRTSNQHLRLSILGSYSRHQGRARWGRDESWIRHIQTLIPISILVVFHEYRLAALVDFQNPVN